MMKLSFSGLLNFYDIYSANSTFHSIFIHLMLGFLIFFVGLYIPDNTYNDVTAKLTNNLPAKINVKI